MQRQLTNEMPKHILRHKQSTDVAYPQQIYMMWLWTLGDGLSCCLQSRYAFEKQLHLHVKSLGAALHSKAERSELHVSAVCQHFFS